MMDGMDLSDPMVRKMADSNHVPAEMWELGGRVRVYCQECAQDWPCATRVALRELEPKWIVDVTPDPALTRILRAWGWDR